MTVMSTFAEPWQPILDTLTKLRGDWPAPDWSWDPRFKCVTSSVAAILEPRIRATLVAATPFEWSPESFTTAPEHVRALAERCGDLRPGQLLMTADPVADLVLFAMWWPWGDGSTLSVRLGVANCDRPKELYPLVRALFGIA